MLGLQVVNKNEVEAMDAGGVPFYAINLAVGISLAIPGFQTDMAKRLLHALPQVEIVLGDTVRVVTKPIIYL